MATSRKIDCLSFLLCAGYRYISENRSFKTFAERLVKVEEGTWKLVEADMPEKLMVFFIIFELFYANVICFYLV